jgi:hypothetical protein
MSESLSIDRAVPPLAFHPNRHALGGQLDAKPLAGFQQLDDCAVVVIEIRGAAASALFA